MISKKEAYKSILAFTSPKDWMDDPKTVEKVQQYAKALSTSKSPNIKYTDINGILVVYADGKKRKYDTIEECVEKEHMARATIARHIRRETRSQDGREFSLL